MPSPPVSSVLERVEGDARVRCAVELACSGGSERSSFVWQRLVDLSGGASAATSWLADGATRRLLPLIGSHLVGSSADADELAAVIAEATAESWGLNQQVLAAASDAVALFGDAGLECLALKGLGLIGVAYSHHVLRPLGDADLLVRPFEAARAVDLLLAAGWRGHRPVRLARLAGTALPFVHPNGAVVDLHWWPAANSPRRDLSGPSLWSRATPAPDTHPLQSSGVAIPALADHLVLLASHATHRSPQLGVHTLVDAHYLIVTGGPDGMGDLTPSLLWAAADVEAVAVRLQMLLDSVREVGVLDVDPLCRELAGPSVAAERRALASSYRLANQRPGAWAGLDHQRHRVLAATPAMTSWDRSRVAADLLRSWSAGALRRPLL